MTPEMLIVLVVLGSTVTALTFDLLRMDLVALLCLLALGWSGVLAPHDLLQGFSSAAVLSMVAVMILGRGIAVTGLMERFARRVLQLSSSGSPSIVATVSASVGLLSGFIQNVGAAALFLPALLSIARRRNLPVSGLIMPVGFAAILGGTLTMVGSGPLIMTNDLLAAAGLRPYGLFAVTPMGLCLLAGSIIMFLVWGKRLLPAATADGSVSPLHQLMEAWQLPVSLWRCSIPPTSSLIGQTPESSGIWQRYQLNILALAHSDGLSYAPWRETTFQADQELLLLGEPPHVQAFSAAYGLVLADEAQLLDELHDPDQAGFAEVVVPPRSGLVGETLHGFGLRRHHALEPVMLFHHGTKARGDVTEQVLDAGDILIVYGPWERIRDLQASSQLLSLTPLPGQLRSDTKTWVAAGCFLLSIGLALAGAPLVLALLSGAAAMVAARVLRMDEAYQAVDWGVVLFLACLIPLGTALQQSGAAALMANGLLRLVGDAPVIVFAAALALLTTVLSLVMSNVAATAVLAPLVVALANSKAMDPRPLVLLVAVSSSNAFLLPTHQVNALFRGPGGYRTQDYLKAGGAVTALFLALVVPLFYLFYF